MTEADILQELESLGSEQTRKTYRRHGVTGNVFGVSYANIDKIAKRIKINHPLAVKLWESGNHDARILATKIADPSKIDSKTAEDWVKDLDNRTIVDAFAAMLLGSPVARSKMEKWAPSRNEWTGRAGWCLLSGMANHAKDVPNAVFETYLDIIEKEIHGRQNYVRQAMNSAIINIGVRNEALRKKALDAAKKVGKVKVDHGDTACKTPDAAQYIQKTFERKAAKE